MVAEPGGPRERGRPRMAERIVDVLIPLIIEEIVAIVKAIFQERISERIREQVVDVHVPGAVEQVTEVPKTSNCDRTSQRAVEQIFDVPVPEMVKQLLEVPETVSQDRIKQRTVEQIVDAPVPQVVEELAESFKVFSQDRIQQRAVEQIIENPADSVAEMTVEVPVIQTPERTQQLVNTHVQHVVNTVEVEKPKLVKLTVQRKKPIIQEKINQVTEQVEVPHVQFLTKVDDMPVVVQRQVSTDQAVQKAMEVPLLQFTDKVVDNPVVAQRQIPVMVQTIQKTTDIPQLQCIDKVIDVPVVSVVQAPQVQVSEKTVEISQLQAAEKFVETRETQTIQGIQTSESLKPDDHDAKIKFFTEEALHGVGGLIFDAHGNRVANELGKRDCVTGEMWENKPPFSLALNNAVSDDRQCKHYTGRGVRNLHESGTALAEDMRVPVLKTPDSIEAHCQVSLKSAKDPDGEPYPAFASEKSWSQASGEIGSEKKFYHNVSSGADFAKTVGHRQVPPDPESSENSGGATCAIHRQIGG